MGSDNGGNKGRRYMSSRILKHGKHEHTIKTVNENVMGILMDDRGTDRVSETFGWSQEKFEKALTKIEDFILFQNATDRLYDAGEPEMLPRSTKTSQLADFLKSTTFRELGIKLETPNDYFMLGFIFCASITKTGMEDLLSRFSGNKLDPEKMLEVLEVFSKAIGER